MGAAYRKVGLIAGAGALPISVLKGAQSSGIDVFVALLEGFAQGDDFNVPSDHFRLGELGRLLKTLKREKVEAICFAGIVKRPNFNALRPDLGTLKYLPGAIAAATKGDDALLHYITRVFEKEGMAVIGPQELCESLLAPLGPLGEVSPTDVLMLDALKARDIAKAIGALDIGQGAVVSAGLVLAVEAQEGTDSMLERVAGLPKDLRAANGTSGVLAKMIKPGQEDRVDLPTIGLETVEQAIKAGLSGIVVEAGCAFVLDREAMISRADEAGLFVLGLDRVADTV